MSSRAIQNLFACFSEQLKSTKQPVKNLKAIDALTHCRTRALGASYYRCKLNHAEIEQLHSCRHRSCYVCAHKQRLDWIEKQKAKAIKQALKLLEREGLYPPPKEPLAS